jgi:putative peptide zinc metalloprotease protein
MGAGLYIVWPAFYTDVTDAYRLGKGGRLRTDLGGVYFNVIFILATAGAYAVTGYEPLLLIIPLQHLEIMHQFLPFIRLDGYYIVSDLTGVPDMFSRIKPTLASLLPWKKASDRVTELKPWVRMAVTAYVLTVVPLLLFMFGLMVFNAPRIFSTAYDSFFVQYHKVQHAFDAGNVLNGVIGIFQMLILVLPAVGIVVTFWLVIRRLVGAVWGRTEGHPAARGAFLIASGAAAAFLGYIWWPNGDYRPIQPGEKGTIQGAVRQFAAVPSGRPALTWQREASLGGAPLLSDRRGPTANPVAPTSTTPTPTTQTATEPSATDSTPTTTAEQTVSTTTPTTTTPTPTTTTATTPTTTTP